MDTRIHTIKAREILDSRGNPTVETMVILQSGYRGIASVPSGASVGTFEAVELRDKDPNRYNGMGVLKAVHNVNNVLAPKLRGKNCLEQKNIDDLLLQLDGSANKAVLGSNALLSISLACAVAAANSLRQPLYTYLNQLISLQTPLTVQKIPTPTMNVINGGLHGAGNLDFQEFHIVPATSKAFHEALRLGVEINQSLKKILIYRNAIHSVGDEGGYAPNLFTNLDALELLMQTIQTTSYQFGVDVFFGLDIAATYFKSDRGYQIKDRQAALNKNEFIEYIKDLHKKYRILILEDPLEENDWDGWKKITHELGQEVLVVGDDLLVTNPKRLERAIQEKACSAILLKPNQIGTLTEFLSVVVMAKKNNLACIVSHRSGETNDTFIADLAVAVQADYVKFGAPVRGERVAKYNRLLQIESELFPYTI